MNLQNLHALPVNSPALSAPQIQLLVQIASRIASFLSSIKKLASTIALQGLPEWNKLA
jgi:hypothetical protein